MNAVEIPHDFALFLETGQNPNRKNQLRTDILERMKPN